MVARHGLAIESGLTKLNLDGKDVGSILHYQINVYHTEAFK